MLAVELIYNTAVFVYLVMLIILFYNRRTNFPTLVVYYFIISLIIKVADTLVITQLAGDLYTEPEKQELIYGMSGSIILAAVWIPYFLLSERVKDTFVFQSKTITSEKEQTGRDLTTIGR